MELEAQRRAVPEQAEEEGFPQRRCCLGSQSPRQGTRREGGGSGGGGSGWSRPASWCDGQGGVREKLADPRKDFQDCTWKSLLFTHEPLKGQQRNPASK